jgi:hypothetical protein
MRVSNEAVNLFDLPTRSGLKVQKGYRKIRFPGHLIPFASSVSVLSLESIGDLFIGIICEEAQSRLGSVPSRDEREGMMNKNFKFVLGVLKFKI